MRILCQCWWVFGLGGLLVAAPACSLVEGDSGPRTADRTVPEALDVRRVPLDTARHTLRRPDTVNVAVYVTDLKICPKGANCFLPDGIKIAETPDPEEGASRLVGVPAPRQFAPGRRYLVSLAVASPSNPRREENRLDLVGYSRLEEESPRVSSKERSVKGTCWDRT